MSITFYEASVESYARILDSVAGILTAGAEYAAQAELDLQEVVMTRLHDDMMPFHFQIVSVAHHSLGAMRAYQSGDFSPPSFKLDKDYQGLQAMIDDARSAMASFLPEEVEVLAEQGLVFKVMGQEIPFTNRNFLLTFSLPNFYFHATTAYDILRMHGVPLGKMQFLGQMKTGN